MKARNPILAVLALTVLVALYFAHREARTPIEPAAPPRLGAPAPNPQEQNEAAGRETGPATEVTPPSPLGSTETRIPPFHPSAAAAQPLPRTLPSTQFAIPIVAHAYEIAARIPKVLAQQPCYCWCDRYGHRSLLDCFASDHGAGWVTCIKEVLLADRMTQQGKRPAEIRNAIIAGQWQAMRLEAR